MSRSTRGGFDKFAYHKSLHIGTALSNAEYRVLAVLWDYTSADGTNGRPGHERLANDCGMSLRTVERCIASLTEKGWIHKDRAARSRGPKGGGFAATYSLRTPPESRAHADKAYDGPPKSHGLNDISAPDDTSSNFESPVAANNHPPKRGGSSDGGDGPPKQATTDQFPSEWGMPDHLGTEPHISDASSDHSARTDSCGMAQGGTRHGITGTDGKIRASKTYAQLLEEECPF